MIAVLKDSPTNLISALANFKSKKFQTSSQTGARSPCYSMRLQTISFMKSIHSYICSPEF